MVYNKSNLRGLVESRKFGLLAQTIDNSHILILDIPLEDDLADMMRVMKEPLMKNRCAITVRKNSPLLVHFNNALQRFIEHGLIHYFKEDSIRRFQKPSYDRILLASSANQRSNNVPLNMRNCEFTFIILVIGCTLSFICFVVENIMIKI